MLVKCRFCSKKIDKKDAFSVKKNGKNLYYCNEQEYNTILMNQHYKNQIYENITNIFGYKVTNTALFKELADLCGTHGYELVYHYICDNTKKLCEAMNKDFVHEYAKIRYFSAIIKNSIVDYRDKEYRQKTYTPPIKYSQDVVETKFKASKQRRALSDIESEVG